MEIFTPERRVENNDLTKKRRAELIPKTTTSKDDVPKKRALDAIPFPVIEIINKFITDHFDGKQATFKRVDLVDFLCLALNMSKEQLFEKRYLEFAERLYGENGWLVYVDLPGYEKYKDAEYVFKLEQLDHSIAKTPRPAGIRKVLRIFHRDSS